MLNHHSILLKNKNVFLHNICFLFFLSAQYRES